MIMGTACRLVIFVFVAILHATDAFLLPRIHTDRRAVLTHASVDRRVVFGSIFSGATQAFALQSVGIQNYLLSHIDESLASRFFQMRKRIFFAVQKLVHLMPPQRKNSSGKKEILQWKVKRKLMQLWKHVGSELN